MSVIILAIIGVYKRAGLSRALLWGFSFWGVLHMVGGLLPIPEHWHTPDTTGVLYSWRIIPGYLKYDQLVHGFGVGLGTWLCWEALVVRVRGHDGNPIRPTLGMLSICATAGMGFGALNEVIEFFAVLILPRTNVGDYENTGWDLFANLLWLDRNRTHHSRSLESPSLKPGPWLTLQLTNRDLFLGNHFQQIREIVVPQSSVNHIVKMRKRVTGFDDRIPGSDATFES